MLSIYEKCGTLLNERKQTNVRVVYYRGLSYEQYLRILLLFQEEQTLEK